MGYKFIKLSLPGGRGYLLPVTNSSVFTRALSIYNVQNSGGKFFNKLLLYLHYLGLTSRIFEQHELEQKELSEKDSQENLFEYIANVFRKDNLVFSLSLGTPGVHRKPVIQIMESDGKILGFMKVGWNCVTKKLVENEISILNKLQKQTLNFKIPTVLFNEEWKGLVLGVLSPATNGQVYPPQELSNIYYKSLKSLSEISYQKELIINSRFWKDLIQIKEVDNHFYRFLINRVIHLVEKNYNDLSIPYFFNHGDFAPWNAKIVNGELFLFDWEYANERLPAGFDLFHFLIQTKWLLFKKSYSTIYHDIRQDLKEPGVVEYFRYVGIENPQTINIILLLYLLNKLIFYLQYEKNNYFKLHGLSVLLQLHLKYFV